MHFDTAPSDACGSFLCFLPRARRNRHCNGCSLQCLRPGDTPGRTALIEECVRKGQRRLVADLFQHYYRQRDGSSAFCQEDDGSIPCLRNVEQVKNSVPLSLKICALILPLLQKYKGYFCKKCHHQNPNFLKVRFRRIIRYCLSYFEQNTGSTVLYHL